MMRSLAVKWIATLLLTSLVGVVLVGLFAYRTTVSEFDRLRTEQSRDAFLEDVTTYYETNQTWDGLVEWLRVNETYETDNPNKAGTDGISPDDPNNAGIDGIPPDDPNNAGMDGIPPDDPNSAEADGVPPDDPNWVESSGMPYKDRRNREPSQLFALADIDGKIVFEYGPFKLGEQMTEDVIEEGTPITINGERVGTSLLAVPPPDLDPREQSYLNRTYQALLVGGIGAGAMALLLGMMLSRHFLQPLTELTNAITEMKHGNLNQQVRVHSQDELGELALTFNQMTAEIHRVNQLRKQMTADIAHDLRTPLMVITGYIEALRDGTLQPTPARFDAMNQEAILLKRLVEDLRTLSLADAGELKLVYQEVQPNDLLEQIKQFFEPIAQEQQITLYVETDTALPTVQMDRERMVQVLANLVTNALRHTPAGGSVKLRAQKQDDGVNLTVTDSGSGIPEDKLPNIFERFYRVDESRNEDQGASGLGLAIAKSIVEAHKGTISAESTLGLGTTMIISLPQAAA